MSVFINRAGTTTRIFHVTFWTVALIRCVGTMRNTVTFCIDGYAVFCFKTLKFIRVTSFVRGNSPVWFTGGNRWKLFSVKMKF